MRRISAVSLTFALAALTACGILGGTPTTPAPTPEATAAPAEAASGPRIVTGKVTYTNVFFTDGVAEPEIILEDQGGFVVRDRKFLIPVASQVIGQITSDFYTSPFTYSISLPAEPNGTLRDVNHDGKTDTGVMVYAVAYWTNTWGDPYLEKRDQGGGGWSTAYASTKVSDDRAFYREVFGGKYLVYAPDDKQQFPSGFGADKKLFTDDDPIMNLQAGWSVIDLDAKPFAVDRSEKPTIDLYEPESAALDDFSKLSYTDAFDKMLDKFKREYAFTDFKKIDWDAKGKQFRPAFEAAEAAKDSHAYALALRDFIWSIPDTHVGFDSSLLTDDFTRETAGGLGFAMRETDDGKTIANFILDGGPAAKAGMQWGAEIISLDGKPTRDAVSAVAPWSSPFSNPIIKRLQQLRYATRFPLAKNKVDVTFKNPGGAEKTATLDVVQENDSFRYASFNRGVTGTELPVEFKILPSGYGYIKVSSFFDNDVLTILVWERALKFFNDNSVPGVILDLRHNGGGNGWLADQMAGYFFDKETVTGNVAYYNKASGAFYMDPGDQTSMIPPRQELIYKGPVVVMVGPACASACEFFSYAMTINNRAVVVGEYPSEGAGGSVDQFKMPENLNVQITIGRAVDPQGNIHLEGKGVVPTVKVPVTADTLKQESDGQDVILAAAEVAVKDAPNLVPGASAEPSKVAGVTPANPPTLASDFDIIKSLQGGDKQLENLAKETYKDTDLTKPGTFLYTINLPESQDLLWVYAWCTKTQAQFDDNWSKIKLAFSLNGQPVAIDQFGKQDAQVQAGPCRFYFARVSKWAMGENVLVTTVTFTAALNDGSFDYPAGDYKYEYHVLVEK